jgi:hypothetical protein
MTFYAPMIILTWRSNTASPTERAASLPGGEVARP